jgi:hypothetical protein
MLNMALYLETVDKMSIRDRSFMVDYLVRNRLTLDRQKSTDFGRFDLDSIFIAQSCPPALGCRAYRLLTV